MEVPGEGKDEESGRGAGADSRGGSDQAVDDRGRLGPGSPGKALEGESGREAWQRHSASSRTGSFSLRRLGETVFLSGKGRRGLLAMGDASRSYQRLDGEGQDNDGDGDVDSTTDGGISWDGRPVEEEMEPRRRGDLFLVGDADQEGGSVGRTTDGSATGGHGRDGGRDGMGAGGSGMDSGGSSGGPSGSNLLKPQDMDSFALSAARYSVFAACIAYLLVCVCVTLFTYCHAVTRRCFRRHARSFT